RTPAIAATRPLIAADPMFLAPSPDVVSESTVMAPAVWVAAGVAVIGGAGLRTGGAAAPSLGPSNGGKAVSGAGFSNRWSSRATLPSIRSNRYCPLSALELPLGPIPIANGSSQPLTSL